ncbi:Glutamate synthase [NADPH] small chain [hydrothermal vent metagenome]|uniref:Dihydrothymine dehydrogenase n=1 Tax=hydrothermal vent metagenome TaxID=652676 RepID=A0A3B0VGG7_9ZZZZ
MKETNTKDVNYYHKVVDCQYACPAHTPVPEYIRMISAGRFTDAYMLNWESNVFPGILGRTCDRPCEPACRRGRVEDEPVAICRLKRVAADNKGNIKTRLPEIPKEKNGKKIALIGGGPASLTVARDLMPLGYHVDLYDEQYKVGGFMRSQIPSFRLPETVLDEEVDYVLDMGVSTHLNHRVTSMKSMLAKDYDAIFVGTGAPRARDLPKLTGRQAADANVHLGIDWLANVAFEHTKSIGKRVLVLGGGNTAMDCCRTARRIGGKDVRIVVRSPKVDMKASPWEIEDAEHEGIPMYENHTPKAFVCENGKLTGMLFELVKAQYDENGKRALVPTGEDDVFMACDDVLMALGQMNAFPWIERDLGLEFNDWDMPEVDKVTHQTSLKNVFVGGDAAWGPENVITAVAHGHQAAISIDKYCQQLDTSNRPAPGTTLITQKMGFHDWLYNAPISSDERFVVEHVNTELALSDRKIEVEKGFSLQQGLKETLRCLNCDVQTVFDTDRCIECDACEDICPTSCINFIDNADEDILRKNLRMPADNLQQSLLVSAELKTKRVMVKDEDVCLHCGLCAERCPTGAWDMRKFLFNEAKAGS